jgi:hypothetical protein
MKAKAKREGALKIPIPFDEAMRRAVTVKPPPEGWAAYEKKAKKKRPAKAKRPRRAA